MVVAYLNDTPVACGAIKEFDSKTMEIKRMFTAPEARGKGIATKIINELENWAKELTYERCILETGKRQVAAVEFYQKNHYQNIPNYGQYKDVENSLCFEKYLT